MSEEREQLLIDLCESVGLAPTFSHRRACDAGIKYMDARITAGELMVVKTVKDITGDDGFKCSECGWSALWEFSNYADEVKFCPGCGAKVIQP